MPNSATEFVAAIFESLAVEAVKGGSLWLYEHLKGWKNKNQKRILDVAQEDLNKRGYRSLDECRQPTEKFIVNFVPAASVEDDPALHEYWGHLLANELDPKFDEKKLRIAFMGMLQQMTAADARLLMEFKDVQKVDIDLCRMRFGFDPASFGACLGNLNRLGCIMQVCDQLPQKVRNSWNQDTLVAIPIPTNFYAKTLLGTAFIETCTG